MLMNVAMAELNLKQIIDGLNAEFAGMHGSWFSGTMTRLNLRKIRRVLR